MLTNLSPTVQAALAASANALIESALHHGHSGLRCPPAGEVKAAHAVTLAGASQCGVAWSPLLDHLRYSVSSTAVFTHAAPIVGFFDTMSNSQINRELADLLVVVDQVQGANVVDRRAQLIQAKLAEDDGSIKLDDSGTGQRNLYLKWPKFRMPAAYEARDWDLNDSSCQGLPYDGCRFGGISLGSSPRYWSQIPTAISMNTSQGVALGTMLARMLEGLDGREAKFQGQDPWSLLVDQLLEKSLNVAFPKSSSNMRQAKSMFLFHSRGEHVFSFRYESIPEALFPYRDSPYYYGGEDYSDGISVLHIVASGND